MTKGLHRAAQLIACAIAIMMLSQGIILMQNPNAGGSASMSALIAACGGAPELAGVILITTFPFTFLAALYSMAVWLVLPQVLISVIYAIGAIAAIINGTYADLYVPKGGAEFIYNDQIAVIVLLLIHSVSAAILLGE